MFLPPETDEFLSPFPIQLTPPTADPVGGDTIRVELNREWLQYATGAVCILAWASTWATSTDEEKDEILRKAQDFIGAMNTEIEEPPFYEDDETADDEQLPTEPWYESLSDWIISAFLALTFTPGAAIVYQTTIPRLRLALRTGDLGAIVRVLLDDLEIWTGNTASPTVGLLEAELDIAAFAAENELGDPPYTLRIEHNGPPGGVDYDDPTYPKGKLEVELGDIRPREDFMQLRQNGCVMELSTDGSTWTTIYDPTDCVDGLIDQGITDAINDGRISVPGGQPGPNEGPLPGTCQTYHVILNGNSQWHLPSPMGYGDTIQVSNVTGGWSDDGINWWCPDGSTYVLGTCSSGGQRHDEGDVLNPGAYHMALIMKAGDTWFNAPTSIFTNTSGTTPIDVVFQANDGSFSDNTGEISFDVEVCTIGWVHTFDFRPSESDYFTPRIYSGRYYAVYTLGSGYGPDVWNRHGIALDSVDWPDGVTGKISVELDDVPSEPDMHILLSWDSVYDTGQVWPTGEKSMTVNIAGTHLDLIGFDGDLEDTGGQAEMTPRFIARIIVYGTTESDPF